MQNGLFITGTGTDVGKSYASGFLLALLNQMQKRTLYYKPVQCGLPGDCDFISKRMGHKFTASNYDLDLPASPHFAFLKGKRKFNAAAVRIFLTANVKKYDFVIMEGAGGVAVPIKNDFDMADLAKLSKFKALIIALPSLGTINHTLLTINYLRKKRVPIGGFMFSYVKGVDYNSEMVLNNAKTIEKLGFAPYCGNIPEFRASWNAKDLLYLPPCLYHLLQPSQKTVS